MTTYLNPNQFAQVPIKGAIDLGITKSGVIAGIVSASQATALVPGQRVKLDTAAQTFTPSFIAAAASDAAIGIVMYSSKGSTTLIAGSAIEVVYFGGPVIWMEAAAAITAGASVEGVATGSKVQTLAAAKRTGVALDGASAAGDLVRVIAVEPGYTA